MAEDSTDLERQQQPDRVTERRPDAEVLDADDQGGEASLVSFVAAQWHEGPLPEVGSFSAYDQVLPGAAERILRLAERSMDLTEGEAAHRHETETKVVDHNIQHESRAQKIATVFGAVGLVAGIVFISIGLSVEGLVALLVPLGAFISRFLDARRQR